MNRHKENSSKKRIAWNKGKESNLPLRKINCVCCGDEIKTRSLNRKYCNQKCTSKVLNKNNSCLDCGIKIWCNRKRCMKCDTKRRINRLVSKETRKKLSLANLKEKSYLWKGGINISSGYRMIYMPNTSISNKRYVFEHKLKWLQENKCGWLYIPNGFIIHHKNGDRLDNRIENLICLPRDYHMQMHTTLRRRK